MKWVKEKFNNIRNIKANILADLLIMLAFVVVFTTTFTLNRYAAMYLLAIFLFLLSYFVAKGGEK